MRILVLLILAGAALFGCDSLDYMTPTGRLDRALKQLAAAKDEQDRFYALPAAAKESFVLGRVSEAREFATELLAMSGRYPKDWNYGNAIHDGNLVLGRIAVGEGRIEDARRFLEVAGNTPGSPQLDSFGPNMSLAKDLLEKEEKEAVLNYFAACKKFWLMDGNPLDQWISDVKAGRMPNFETNLIY